MLRRQSFTPSLSVGSGEPQIIVEETNVSEEEIDRRKGEPESPSLDPYLLSPWRDTRKHSLPTPQCTSGITASQVRRLSERGGEGSGPSPRETAFLTTLSQAPAPQPGGRRHSVVTISKVPMGATRIFPVRRESSAGLSGPPSNSGSSHNLQLDIMDDIAKIKTRKVRLKMWKTPSRERMCEVQPLEGNSMAQRYVQQQQRRYSDFVPTMLSGASTSTASMRRRASELPMRQPAISPAAGIVCSNTDLISILSSLTSSATEINRCGDDSCQTSREESTSKTKLEEKRSRLKDFRSNSFDVSILHGTGTKLSGGTGSPGGSGQSNQSGEMVSNVAPTNWFANRHQPMWKKQKSQDIVNLPTLSFKFEKSKVIKAMKESLLTRTNTLPKDSGQSVPRHKVVWDASKGTKVDAQVLGSAIEEFLNSQSRPEVEAGTSAVKSAVSPGKNKTGSGGKIAKWFAGATKEEESTEACEASICPSLKDLFVK